MAFILDIIHHQSYNFKELIALAYLTSTIIDLTFTKEFEDFAFINLKANLELIRINYS